jgi:hypothetical protein
MNKTSIIALLMIPALTAGCSKRADQSAGPEATPPATADVAAAPDGSSARSASKAHQAPMPTVPMLAYAHVANLELPGRAIRPLMERHQTACELAGPTQCQVLSAKVDDDHGEVAGSLTLQAQPGWLAGFRARLDGDATDAGGRIRESGTDTEDLSRSIVDTEAAIRAKTTLRDRVQHLLATHQGKLGDLVALEQQLAQVQGEIDASRSELAVMRTRVQTSKLTIGYSAIPTPMSGRAVEPLKHSVDGAFSIVMRGLAVIVSLAAVLAPFFIVGVPVWLFVSWRLRRRTTPVRPNSSASA